MKNLKCKKHKTVLVCFDCGAERRKRREEREWKKRMQEIAKADGFEKKLQKIGITTNLY